MAHGIQLRALGIAALALMGMGLGGCLREDAEAATSSTQTSAPGLALTEAQVAGIVSTLNRGEIEQAETALQITDSAEVRAYAQRMIEAHRTSEKRLDAILPEIGAERAESNLAQDAQRMGETMNENLKNLASGQDPDSSYVEIQIFMHRRTLAVLDEQLIPKADRAEVRAFLQETRGAVQAHLIDALRIRRRFALLD
jgi:putative membrane protein